MKGILKKLVVTTLLAFSITGVFIGGRIIAHSNKNGILASHQLGRSLMITGGIAAFSILVQILLSIKRMNDNYKEGIRWS
jgi:hypothetical protein